MINPVVETNYHNDFKNMHDYESGRVWKSNQYTYVPALNTIHCSDSSSTCIMIIRSDQ